MFGHYRYPYRSNSATGVTRIAYYVLRIAYWRRASFGAKALAPGQGNMQYVIRNTGHAGR